MCCSFEESGKLAQPSVVTQPKLAVHLTHIPLPSHLGQALGAALQGGGAISLRNVRRRRVIFPGARKWAPLCFDFDPPVTQPSACTSLPLCDLGKFDLEFMARVQSPPQDFLELPIASPLFVTYLSSHVISVPPYAPPQGTQTQVSPFICVHTTVTTVL